MAEQPIRKEDIIDIEGTKKAFNELIAILGKLSTVIHKDLIKSANQLEKSLQGVNTATKEGQEIIKEVSTQSEILAAQQKELAKIDNEQIRLKAKISSLDKQEAIDVVRLKKAIEEKNRSLKESVKLEGSAVSSVNKMRSRLKELTAEYNKLGSAARKQAAPAINKLTDELKKAESAIGNNTRNVGNYSSALKGMGTKILAAAGFVGGATMVLRGFFNVIKNGFKTSIAFEAAMSDVKAVSRATGEDFNKLRQNAIELGSATKFTATEVAGLQKEYAKLGFTTREILRITEATLDLAAATGSDLPNAANIAGATLRQFAFDASRMQEVVDVMTLSFSMSALDIEKFSVAMSQAGPVANAVGDSVQQATAKLSLLANAGLDASKSGTSLRNIYLELEKQGLSWDQAMTKIQGSQNRASTSLELFGKRGAVAGLILADNASKLDELTEAYNNADGSAKAMADTMLDNVAGSATILKSAWEGLILRTNESEGALKGFLDTLTLMVSTINTKGKPALDRLFDHRQIETFGDKWKFVRDQGVGFWATLANAVVRSKDTIQGWADEMSVIGDQILEDELKIEDAKLAANAAEKKRHDDELKRIQAEIDAAEIAAEAEKTRIKELERWREKTKDDKIARIELEEIESLNIVKKYAGLTLEEIQKRVDAEKLVEQELADWKGRLIDDSFDTISNSLNTLAGLYEANKQKELSAAGDNAAKREAIEIKYAKKQQLLSIGQALVNGAMAITEIWRKWAANPVLAAIFTGVAAAQTVAQVAIIKGQKFAHGGSGVLEGAVHASGGVKIPGIGEAESGEHLSITSRTMTSKYGGRMLDAVSNSINQGKFFEVWSNANKDMGVHQDVYTKKMYEMMRNTPTTYLDTNGDTVKEYPDGKKYVIKRKIWKN